MTSDIIPKQRVTINQEGTVEITLTYFTNIISVREAMKLRDDLNKVLKDVKE